MIEKVKEHIVAEMINRVLTISEDVIEPKKEGYIIRYKSSGSARYHTNSQFVDMEEHRRAVDVLVAVFLRILSELHVTEVFIGKNDISLTTNSKINANLNKVLSGLKISAKKDAVMTDDITLIESLFTSSLKAAAFPIFITNQHEFTLIPTDHLDLFITFDMSFDPNLLNIWLREYLKKNQIEISPWE